jgi:hypothetical protein
MSIKTVSHTAHGGILWLRRNRGDVARQKVPATPFISKLHPSSVRRHTTNVLDAILSYNERIIPLVEPAWYTRWSLKQSALTVRPAFGIPP